MKLEETAIVLGKFSLVFPNYNLTEHAVMAWWDLFREESALHFEAAFRATVKETGRGFFPTPGEVVKNLRLLTQPQLPTAEEVWSRLEECARRGDSKGAAKIASENEAAREALRRVDFHQIQFCDTQREKPWRQKDFIETYNRHIERTENQNAVRISYQEAKTLVENIDKRLIAVK